jgi:hypothetical protein
MAAGSGRRSPLNRRVVSFGWELVDLFNTGADVYFPVEVDMHMIAVEVDIATMLLLGPGAPGPGPLQVLCTGAVGRGAPPSFGPPPQAALNQPASSNAGAIAVYNPSDLDVTVDPSTPGQGGFLRITLKAWSPADGSASSASRHVRTTPNLRLDRGDYLGFHMEHSGPLVDAELQVVIGYRLRAGES